jgi:sigma-B regulation protein RsbU (phosphoserine phosphatase)
MAAEIDLDRLLEVIVDRATGVMEAERSSLFLYDEPSQTLTSHVSGTLERGSVRVPRGTGIAGHVAETGALLNIPDAYADPRFSPRFDKETNFRTRSILCVPMVARNGRLMGVLQALNKAGGGAFSVDDEELLLAFASHAAIAIDRAQLVEASIEKERIEESLRLAHDIQMAMLPRAFPERPGLELFGRLVPARSVGGDLFDVVDDGDRVFVLVGDVSGKGVAAALFMAVTKTLFRASIEQGASPAAILARVNRELCRDNERAMFVTVFLGCLDLRAGELVYSNAGHNPPYRMRSDGSLSEIEGAHGMALGILEDYEYGSAVLPLEVGDCLFLFTDGIVEALNEAGAQFSSGRLEESLRTQPAARPARVVEDVLTSVQAFVGNAPQFDDITALAVRLT